MLVTPELKNLKLLNNPRSWRSRAIQLKYSADVLLLKRLEVENDLMQLPVNGDSASEFDLVDFDERMSTYYHYLMIISFSMENILKGILMCIDENESKEPYKYVRGIKGKYKGKRFNGHQLNYIISEINRIRPNLLELNNLEYELLDKLTIYNQKGRYPCVEFDTCYNSINETNYDFRNPTNTHHLCNLNKEPLLINDTLEKFYNVFDDVYNC